MACTTGGRGRHGLGDAAEVAERQPGRHGRLDVAPLVSEQALDPGGVDRLAAAGELLGDGAEDDRSEVRQQRAGHAPLDAEERRQRLDDRRRGGVAKQRAEEPTTEIGDLGRVRPSEHAGEVAEHAQIEATEGTGQLAGTLSVAGELGEAAEQRGNGGSGGGLRLRLVRAGERPEAAEHLAGQLFLDEINDIHALLPEAKKRRHRPRRAYRHGGEVPPHRV